MKKRFLSAIIGLCMLATLTAAFPTSVNASVDINIGDYIQMGTYYGVPILWRCVSFDKISGYDAEGNPIIDSTDTRTTYADGYLPLMLSDKLICIKPFDAAGENNIGSHGRAEEGYTRKQNGSDYWEDSNIRCWLNSSASAGEVVWLCGNPPDEEHVFDGYNEYNNEAGFLTHFTNEELNAVKKVTQKSLLSYFEYSNIMDYGDNWHQYSNIISYIIQNYNTAFSELVTDSLFLLDVKQVNTVYNNSDILGDEYYIGKPTPQCVENSEYKDFWLISANKVDYWLRTPDASNTRFGHSVRNVDAVGEVHLAPANVGFYGVRPALYLNTDCQEFIDGSGTEINPYVFSSKVPVCGKIKKCGFTDAGVEVNIEIYGIDDGALITLGAFDKDGRLLGVKLLNAKDISRDITLKYQQNGDLDGGKIKAFIWSDDFIPLCSPIVYNVSLLAP